MKDVPYVRIANLSLFFILATIWKYTIKSTSTASMPLVPCQPVSVSMSRAFLPFSVGVLPQYCAGPSTKLVPNHTAQTKPKRGVLLSDQISIQEEKKTAPRVPPFFPPPFPPLPICKIVAKEDLAALFFPPFSLLLQPERKGNSCDKRKRWEDESKLERHFKEVSLPPPPPPVPTLPLFLKKKKALVCVLVTKFLPPILQVGGREGGGGTRSHMGEPHKP